MEKVKLTEKGVESKVKKENEREREKTSDVRKMIDLKTSIIET